MTAKTLDTKAQSANRRIAVAINVHSEPVRQIDECFRRVAANLPNAKVAIFLDGVNRLEVFDRAKSLGFFPEYGAQLGSNATWNLWWLRMLEFFFKTEADICFKFDPDTMIDAAPKAIPSGDYFGHVSGDFVQGGITGLSRRAVRALLDGRLLEADDEEPRPWLTPVPGGDFQDDQLIARALAHAGILPTRWRECRSRWRRAVPNDPIRYAIVHPRYYPSS